MILVDWQIMNSLKCEKMSIEPFDESRINPNSYDLTLGNTYQISIPNGGIDPHNQKDIESGFCPLTRSEIWIQPGSFLLAATRERIALPNDICAYVTGKSSIGRLGIDIHKTAGWIDAGFAGDITLEMCNCSPNPVRLTEGMPIAQIIFYATQPAKQGYGDRKHSKYQHQSGATLSRYCQNAV